jgi:hypothetical protein
MIGEGACAKVYDVTSVKDASVTYPLVAKVIPLGSGKGKKLKDTTRLCNTLNYEKDLYNGVLLDFPYRPQTPFRGFFGDDYGVGVRYLVMERLGCDLYHFATASSSSPTHKDVAQIGLQILEGMKLLHNKGFLFVDSKPQNFMLRDGQVNDLKFVDFGCAERWMSYNGGGARAQNTRALVGTPEFASLSCLGGNLPTRIDDVECMCLVLLSLRRDGRLPWAIATSEVQVRDMVAKADITALCAESGVPEVGEVLLDCRQQVLSAGDATPNYAHYEKVLRGMAGRAAMRGAATSPKSRRTGPKSSSSSSGSSSSKMAAEGHEEGEEVVRKVRANPKPKKAAAAPSSSSGRRATMQLTEDSEEEEEGGGGGRVTLEVISSAGSDVGRKFVLHEGGKTRKTGVVATTGRGELSEVSLQLDDEFVSDVHCSFRVVVTVDAKGRQRVALGVKDERTTNGTKVNDTKLAKSGVWLPISAGDVVKIGKTKIQVMSE